MKNLTELRPKQIVVFLLLISTLSLQLNAKVFLDSSENPSPLSLYLDANNARYNYPDSSMVMFQASYASALKQGDTIQAINSLVGKAEVFGHQAKYKNSYDELWKALFLADESKNDIKKAEIYVLLGRYYSFYKRRIKALHYFGESLAINKKLVNKEGMDPALLVQNYYAICATYRELGEPELAKTYLDSCFTYHSLGTSSIQFNFLQFEQACIFNSTKQFEEAIALFNEIQPWFETRQTSYLVLFYAYQGDAYMGLNNFIESEKYYQKSLEISKTYNSHIDFSPIVHEKLSNLYLQKGDYKKAYQKLREVKELDAVFFDSRSENNRPLLEIQDEFRKQKEYQDELLQQQRIEQLEHEEDIWLLQSIILIVSLVFVFLVGVLYLSYIRTRHKSEKKVLQTQKELELQKANEIVELKNKELAASALKLIEKDEHLSLLKDKLKSSNGEVNVQELKQIMKSISISNARNWEEFEARFVAVNESFFDRLTHKFPKLTRGDLKLCALIKLNFSSKEMAQLLGISVESTHTFRYRLRKKLQLSRETNLTEFIAAV